MDNAHDAVASSAGFAEPSSTYLYRDAEKRRAYMRDLMRRRRAKKQSGLT